MKKGIVIVLIIIIVSLVSFFPITQNSTINISASFDNIMLQIVHVENWKNWYPEINKAYKKNPPDYSIKKNSLKKIDTITIPGEKFIIRAISPMSYNVTEISSHQKTNFAFTVFPGDSKNKMNIYLETKSPLILTLFNNNKAGENALNSFKSFMEMPKDLYGYDIKMSEIRDPIIASRVIKIKNKDIFVQMANSRKELMNYLKRNNLEKTGYISVSYIPMLHDSIQVTVGIPVNKIAASYDGIECLSLPVKGRVLVANYEGLFSGRFKIYQAMSKYLTDHTLSIPAESFERYLKDSLPSSDSAFIRIELNYPVY